MVARDITDGSDRLPVIERVVLVGFMGSGKTAVGRILAKRLGWRFIDLDSEVERREGRAIGAIFDAGGEDAFRTAEVAATRALPGDLPFVLSTGGGWVTNPGVFDLLGPRTVHVWLRASVQTILERVSDPGEPRRPLLEVPDPTATIQRMLRARLPLYARADLTVDTDGRTASQVAEEIVRYLRPRLSEQGAAHVDRGHGGKEIE